MGLAILLSAQLACGTAPPLTGPAADLPGVWMGTWRLTALGSCRLNGGNTEEAQDIKVVIRVEADGTLAAAKAPKHVPVRRMSFDAKGRLAGGTVRLDVPSQTFCFSPTARTSTTTYRGPAPSVVDGRWVLRLEGVGDWCPERGCRFREVLELTWDGDEPLWGWIQLDSRANRPGRQRASE